MKINRLNARELPTLKDGWHLDGKGLHFVVEGTWKHWELLYSRIGGGGKKRQMPLGSYPDVGLAEARDKRDAARRLRKQGVDPIDAGKAAERKQVAEAVRNLTFKEATEEWLKKMWPTWRPTTVRSRSGGQWSPEAAAKDPTIEIGGMIGRHILPKLGHRRLSEIGHRDVYDTIKAAAGEKSMTPTADKVWNDIVNIFSFGLALCESEKPNPARYDGPLSELLLRLEDVHVVQPHKSMPYGELPAFMAELRAFRRGRFTAPKAGVKRMKHLKIKPWTATITTGRKPTHLGCFATEEEAKAAYKAAADEKYGPAETRYAITALLLEMVILTATRGGREVTYLRWDEIYEVYDDDDNVEMTIIWIPPERIKTGKKTSRDGHVIPLSRQALAVIDKCRAIQMDDRGHLCDYVFVNGRSEAMSGGTGKEAFGQPLCSISVYQFLTKTMKSPYHPHGFRTSHTDWAHEHSYDARDIEASLDHALGDIVQRSYHRRRGPQGEKLMARIKPRHKLMQEYADYIDQVAPAAAKKAKPRLRVVGSRS
jgi:integrase